MVGTAIKSILSDYNVYGLEVPRSRGAKWIIYTGVSRIGNRTKDGVSTLDRYRFQLDCYARKETDMDTLGEAVKTLLDDYSGTVESIAIDLMVFEDEDDSFEVLGDEGGSEPYHRRRQDYTIWIKP